MMRRVIVAVLSCSLPALAFSQSVVSNTAFVRRSGDRMMGPLVAPMDTIAFRLKRDLSAAPWVVPAGVVVTHNALGCPYFYDGTLLDKVDNTGADQWTGGYQHLLNEPPTGTVTVSAWIGGNTVHSIVWGCGSAAAASGARCRRSDGGTCSVGVSGNNAWAYATGPTSAITRLTLTVACANSPVDGYVTIQGGQYNVSTGAGCFAGLQIDFSDVATAYQIVTQP